MIILKQQVEIKLNNKIINIKLNNILILLNL